MRLLETLVAIAFVALSVPALAQREAGAAPTNLVAHEACQTLDVSWEGVDGAPRYAIDVLVDYDPASTACENAPAAPYLFRYSVVSTVMSIDYSSFLMDFGSGLQAPCRITGVRVKALGPGLDDRPFATAIPAPSCL